jgi:hypothetical protein
MMSCSTSSVHALVMTYLIKPERVTSIFSSSTTEPSPSSSSMIPHQAAPLSYSDALGFVSTTTMMTRRHQMHFDGPDFDRLATKSCSCHPLLCVIHALTVPTVHVEPCFTIYVELRDFVLTLLHLSQCHRCRFAAACRAGTRAPSPSTSALCFDLHHRPWPWLTFIISLSLHRASCSQSYCLGTPTSCHSHSGMATAPR